MNNQNPFNQIQLLLIELSNHVSKINEIIIQMNNAMNQINLSMNNQFNNQLNDMNNFINMMNMNMNMNPINCNINDINKKENDEIFFNFRFKNPSIFNVYTSVSIEENKTINDLLNEYFRKNNRFDCIDNYDKNISFIYNSENINSFKNKKIKDYFKNPNGNSIDVIESKNMI